MLLSLHLSYNSLRAFFMLNMLNSPSLSLQERCSSHLIILRALSWTYTNKPTSFLCLCWGLQAWVQYSGEGGGLVHESRVEGDNHFPCPAGHACFYAAQGTIGLLFSSTRTHRSFSLLSVCSSLSLCWCVHLTLGSVKLFEICVSLLSRLRNPFGCISSFCHISCTTQLGTACKHAESALDPTVCFIINVIKYYQFQYGLSTWT